MADPRLARLAHLLVQYCAPVERGHTVELSGTTLAAPLLREIYRETVRAGGVPFLRLQLPDQDEILLKTADEPVLTAISPVSRLVIETFDRLFQVRSEENTQTLAGVDPARQARWQQARAPLAATSARRTAEGSLQWTVCPYPTPGYAQDAGLSLADYEEFVYGACLLDQDDPAAAWRAIGARQQRLVASLAGKRELHIVAPGTDLRLSIAGRAFLDDHGHRNMPGGEIFTSPVEDATEGTIQFSFPAAYSGQVVDGVRLRFAGGRVVEAAARANEAFLGRMLDLDGGARLLGECAFGTNPGIARFTRNVLFDEKIGGTMHLALGQGFAEVGGRNTSALHWDMVTDLRTSAEVRVDGELFIKDGEFVRAIDAGTTGHDKPL